MLDIYNISYSRMDTEKRETELRKPEVERYIISLEVQVGEIRGLEA